MKKLKKVTKKEFMEMSVEERGKLLIKDYLMVMLKVTLRGKPNASTWDNISCPRCQSANSIGFGVFEQEWMPCRNRGFTFPEELTPPHKGELANILRGIEQLKKFMSNKEIFEALLSD